MILEQSIREYFGRPLDFISPSDIKTVNTPKKFYYKKYIHKKDPEEEAKKVFRVGEAFHVAILQQHLWKEKVVVYIDPYPGRTMGYKPKKNHFTRFETDAKVNNKVVLFQDEFEMVQNMKRSLAKNMDISLINPKGAIIEQSFYAKLIFNKDGTVDRIEDLKDFEEVNKTSKDDLVMFICTKPDYVRKSETGCIDLDLKSCKSADPAIFRQDSYKMGYHVQAAMGVDISGACLDTETDLFIFIVFEKEPPYDGLVYYASNDLIEYGRGVYQRRLWEIWKARKAGYFEGYSIYSDMENIDEDGQDVRKRKMVPLDLPHYARDPGYQRF